MAPKEKKENKINTHKKDSASSEFIKRFKTNPLIFIGTIIVLVIVIIAFVFVPAIVPSAGGLGGDLSFGSYNRVPINYVPGNYFSQVREILSRQYGFPEGFMLWQTAFEETVVYMGILDEMRSSGYTAPAALVDRRVAQLPDFQENGVFSATRYRSLDRSRRMAIWRQEQDNIMLEYYRNDMTNLLTSSKEARFISSMNSPQRTFDLISFSIRNYPNEELISYANRNRDIFTVVHLSQITVTSSEREARQILSAIQAGTTNFEDSARTHSRDFYAERGGDGGLRMAYEFDTIIPDSAERASVISLSQGELSNIIKVDDGWAFFRAEAEPKQADTSDPTLLDRIRTYMLRFDRGQIENFFIIQAEEFIRLAKEMGFDEAIEEKEMVRQSFGPIPINYGNSEIFTPLYSFSVNEISNAEYIESFWQSAFSTPLLSPSNPLVIGDYVIVLYPKEESTDEEDINAVYRENNYISRWAPNFVNQSIRNYFLTNPKLDNRFTESFYRYVQP